MLQLRLLPSEHMCLVIPSHQGDPRLELLLCDWVEAGRLHHVVVLPEYLLQDFQRQDAFLGHNCNKKRRDFEKIMPIYDLLEDDPRSTPGHSKLLDQDSFDPVCVRKNCGFHGLRTSFSNTFFSLRVVSETPNYVFSLPL